MTTLRVISSSGQRGFAAIAAIFLVVTLAALGAFMVTFSNTQQVTLAQDVQGSRAYWAARAGLEWGLSQGLAVSACPAASTLPIEGFSVDVSCALQTYTDNGTVSILRFTAVARSSGAVGSVGFIERSVSVAVEI
jgi:MSHA biogenesis protein MshP